MNKYASEGRDKLQKVSVESFYEHFSKLNEANPENDFGDIDLDNLPDFNMRLMPQLLWMKSQGNFDLKKSKSLYIE